MQHDAIAYAMDKNERAIRAEVQAVQKSLESSERARADAESAKMNASAKAAMARAEALIVNASSFRGQAKSTVSPLFHESAVHLLWAAGALATCQPERIGHYELLRRRLGNPTTGACPCRSARTRATPAAAAPARQRASKRHAGWLSRGGAVLRGTVRRGTQPRPHTHTHAHSYQPVCIINTYYLTYPTPHTRDARLGRRQGEAVGAPI